MIIVLRVDRGRSHRCRPADDYAPPPPVRRRAPAGAAILVIAALMIIACGPEAPPAPMDSREAAPSPTATPAQPVGDATAPQTRAVEPRGDPPQPPARSDVTLTFPATGATVTENPITIRGTARTFENHVTLRVLDGDGNVVTESYATARGELGNFNPWEASLLLTSIPKSPIALEAIDYSAKDGSVRSTARRTFNYAPRPVALALYFPRKGASDCKTLVAVRRNVPATQSLLKLAVIALIDGPLPSEQAAGAVGIFPKGSAVHGVNLRDGIATIDFNDALVSVGGACRAEAIRASVTATAKALSGVREVQIFAMGKKSPALEP